MRLDLMKRVLAALAFVALIGPSGALAATLYISEFQNAVGVIGTTQAQVYPQIAVTDQTVGLSGSTASSAAFNAKTHAVQLICDEGCSVNFNGSAATTSNYLLQQGVPYQFVVAPGGSVAAIANAAGNTATGTVSVGTVTLASGAVASGAYSSGSIASGAFASGALSSGSVASGALTAGAISDGADVTQGAKADAKSTATDTTPISVMSVLKEISSLEQAPASRAVTNAGTFAVQSAPAVATSGGVPTTYVLEPTASDNHAVIKAGAGQVYWISAFNNSATINYLRLYNATTGFNGCNSATGIVWEGHIPASTSDAGFTMTLNTPLAFTTGISICVTSAYGQTNTTSATASAMSITIGYN